MQAMYSEDCGIARRKIPRRVDGTFEWVTQDPKFLKWINDPDLQILNIYGEPGCGKSVFASWLVDERNRTRVGCIVLYFFFDRDGPIRKTAVNLLRSLLHQLFEVSKPMIPYVLRHFHLRGPRMMEELNVLWSVFADCILMSPRPDIFCIVDDIDECEEISRGVFLRLLEELSMEVGTPAKDIKFVFTSRSDNIKPQLYSVAYTGYLHLNPTAIDISTYVDYRIERLPWINNMNKGCRRLLTARLVQRAYRSFLWLSLMLNLFETIEDNSFSSIQSVLYEIPDTLEAIYERFMEQIPDERTTKAKVMLEILTIAKRPLSTDKMNHAWSIALDQECAYCLGNSLQLDFERTIKLLCGPLAHVSEGYCYLVHPTAKRFLLSAACDRWYAIDFGAANALMAKSCIEYLTALTDHQAELKTFLGLPQDLNYLSFEFPPTPWLRFRLKAYNTRYLFLGYAVEHWAYHLRNGEEVQSSMVIDIAIKAKRLYSTELLQLRWWLSMDWQDFSSVIREDYTEFPFLGLNLCAHNGDLLVFKSLSNDQEINSHGPPFDYTPLHMAILGCQHEMLEWLIHNGADVDLPDARGETPLCLAYCKDNVDAITVLLAHGADSDTRDLEGNTPLMRSIRSGSQEQLELLIKHGADVNAVNIRMESSLHLAVATMKILKVELLLEHGAVPTVLDSNLRSPLHTAVEMGLRRIATLLLQFGANTTFRDIRGWVPLDYAFQNEDFGSSVNCSFMGQIPPSRHSILFRSRTIKQCRSPIRLQVR